MCSSSIQYHRVCAVNDINDKTIGNIMHFVCSNSNENIMQIYRNFNLSVHLSVRWDYIF